MRKTIISIILALFIITPLANALAYGTNYRYTGKPFDPTVNLYDYGARSYQPDIGRFVQHDPLQNYLTDPQKLKQATGQDLQKFLENPQALNEYSYTQNNPVRYVDPDGNFAILPAVVIAASLAFTAWDIHDAYKTFNSTKASLGEKVFNYGALALDVIPGMAEAKGTARVGVEAVKAGKVAEKSKDLIELVHVSDMATDVIKNGFEKVRGLWVNDLSKSNPFRGEHLLKHVKYDIDRMMNGGDYGKFFFEIPKTVYYKLVKDGFIDISKTYETYIKPAAMEIITSYLKK